MKSMEKIKTILTKPKTISTDSPSQLFIKSNGMLHNLNYDDILFISAAVDYIEVQTKEKKYLVHSSMNKTEEKLPTNHFFRIHRSTIINVNHIKRIDKDFVEIDQNTFKIAPGKKEVFLKFINSL
jgi:DNA-binding LytR/AlgR family response regulator